MFNRRHAWKEQAYFSVMFTSLFGRLFLDGLHG
jgi:hypothetical protein